MLLDAGLNVSIVGRGRWIHIDFFERAWRSLSDERLYLHALGTGSAIWSDVGIRTILCRSERSYSALKGRASINVYQGPDLQTAV